MALELSSVSPPSAPPSNSLLSDPAPPPPTYDEATDPTFVQRFQKFAQNPVAQWPGFHPAEVSKLTRQMSRQRSRNSRTPQDEMGENKFYNPEDEEPAGCCMTISVALAMFFVFLIGLGFFLIPIAMIVVGAVFYGECSEVSPYPMWLVVGGASVCVIIFFTCCLMISETNNLGLYCVEFLLLVFPIIWYFFGCWYLLGGVFTRGKSSREVSLIYGEWVAWKDFEQTDCIYPYWIVFSLVVTPLALIGLAVALCVLAFCGFLFTSTVDDEPNQEQPRSIVDFAPPAHEEVVGGGDFRRGAI